MLDRKQVKHWRARQRAWVEDARYLRFKASRLDNPELVIHGLMTETALNLMAANRAMDALILAMSAEDELWGPGNLQTIPAEENS